MESSPSRDPSSALPAAGVKRPATLLPAFEPLSSSPSLPRPSKRVARDGGDYPTPMPTSSTHFMSSSPPRVSFGRPASQQKRPGSMASERVPLSNVPTLMLPESGEPILMGRSSASCHHQLSTSRLISRVHVKAIYKPSNNPFDRDRVEILCMGWNGIRVSCQGKTYDLGKGKTFTSEIRDADIMIDVQDARVLVQWPRRDRRDSDSSESDPAWDESSPRRNSPSMRRLGSPLRDRHPLISPVSPSPAGRPVLPSSSAQLTPSRSHNPIVVYEDQQSPTRGQDTQGNTSTSTQPLQSSTQGETHSRPSSSALRAPSQQSDEDFSDHDEENDPIVHSFGPYGANLLPWMASIKTDDSPARVARTRAEPASSTGTPAPPVESKQPTAGVNNKTEESKMDADGPQKQEDERQSIIERIQNHAVNQLAFSRLSSTPLSTIVNNLPAELWKNESNPAARFTKAEIQSLLGQVKCIGEVRRQGKDAAGKPLESEFYYIADHDEDEMRRQAVVNDLRKPGLRNCRKQHKQYFWRKPK
ncbi:hypothetical protein VTN31DRAFT_7150 [Thermomyces dupontii]|uniref:uncharacterized protein n=1 Tax=Talaromyces thermophilus TaxID=28565 RepID=UPI00374323C6